MHNDTTYERAFKLWISLWNLVLEDKRHLETVTALLQKLVFNTSNYPRCKNWPAICNIENPLMRMTLATLDMKIDDEQRHRIVAAFPECFGYEETHGPYPLSMIRADAERNARTIFDSENDGCALLPVAYEAVPNDVPLQGFDKFGNRRANFEGPRLPDGIDPNAPQGSSIEWNGKKFVVIENDFDSEELWIIPAECVRVDL